MRTQATWESSGNDPSARDDEILDGGSMAVQSSSLILQSQDPGQRVPIPIQFHDRNTLRLTSAGGQTSRAQCLHRCIRNFSRDTPPIHADDVNRRNLVVASSFCISPVFVGRGDVRSITFLARSPLRRGLRLATPSRLARSAGCRSPSRGCLRSCTRPSSQAAANRCAW